jgi:thiamine transport system permease protein
MRNFLAPLLIFAALALGVVPLIAFAIERGGSIWPDAYVWRVTWFTLLQATLSTVLSVGFAVPVARALVRQQFWGRQTLLALFAVPLSLPVIVAVFGIAALYGNSGVLPGIVELYGLQGIVLAHVFFNLPLAARLLLEALDSITPENHRLAAQLGFRDYDVWRHVDWPVLRPALPRVAALVFLLSAASFVIVLTFGGPGATTLEVAIYQSLRMDFDVSRALTLSLIQVTLSLALVWAASHTLTLPQQNGALRLQAIRSDGRRPIAKLSDSTAIALAALLVLPPLLAVLIAGIMRISVDAALLRAFVTSSGVALLSATLALPLAWALAVAQARLPPWRSALLALGLGGYLVPPAVLSTGLFLAFRNVDGGLVLSVLLISAMNALMSLPFLMTVLGPALIRSFAQHDRLCAQLGVTGLNRLRLIDVPSARSALAQAALMAFVLSLGDVTAVTLLGSQGLLTLPSLVQQQMGHYQSAAAGGTALVLAALCLGLTFAAQRLSRWT